MGTQDRSHIGRIEVPHCDMPTPHRFLLSEPAPDRQRAMVSYVPRSYEPRYAYPLLVLFHGRGGDERQLLQLVPKLSERNYVAVALRGPQTTRPRRDGTEGYAWAEAAPGAQIGEGVATLERPRMPSLSELPVDYLADYAFQAVDEVRRRLNIHPRRIFLVGYGEGAAAAYRLGLGMPTRFAGMIAINGWMPRPNGPLIWLPDARRLQVLIAHGLHNQVVPVSHAEAAHRLLYTAGLDSTPYWLDYGHRIPSTLPNLLDHWLMQFCNASLSAPLPI